MKAHVQNAIIEALAEKPLTLRGIIAEVGVGTTKSVEASLARLVRLHHVVMTDGRAIGGAAIYALSGQRCPTCGCMQPRQMRIEQ